MDHKTTKIVDAARELLKSFGYFVDTLWHVDDIHFICEQNGIPRISDEEAMEVFQVAKEQFDGEHGLSWPQLEKALFIFLHRQTVMSILYESSPV
jgi:hypothetical protein